MDPVEEVIEIVPLRGCEGIDWYVGVKGFLDELLHDPVQGAAADMVIDPQNAVVPVMEMGILLVKDV